MAATAKKQTPNTGASESDEEEVEVQVRQIDNTQGAADMQPLGDLFRRVVLAGIGAMAATGDEAERLVNRLVERGELAQKDAEKVMNETMEKFRRMGKNAAEEAEAAAQSVQTPPTSSASLNAQIESNLEQFLTRLNIPSKRDIDELSAKIAQLAARVEELRRQQTSSESTGSKSGSGGTGSKSGSEGSPS